MERDVAVAFGLLVIAGSFVLSLWLIGLLVCAATASTVRWPGKVGLGLVAVVLGGFVLAFLALFGVEPRGALLGWTVLVGCGALAVWTARGIRRALRRSPPAAP
jgi:hypothetical protein